VPEEEVLEENPFTRFSKVQAKEGQSTKDQSVRIKKLSTKARMLTKVSAKVAGQDLDANEGTNIPARGQALIGTGLAIRLPHNTPERIATLSSLAVKHRLMTNTCVIEADYRGQVKLVLANLGDQPYRGEKGARIAQLIIEKIDTREQQEVTHLQDTERGDQGFGSFDTIMNQSVKSQKAKPPMEFSEILARAFGQFYGQGEMMQTPRWDEVDHQIQPEAINISTELAIKNNKNHQDQDFRDTVPQEYHHLLDLFAKGEKITVPPHQSGIPLGIDPEEEKMVLMKKIYAFS